MNCEKIQEHFADYLTGDIDAAAAAEVRTISPPAPPARRSSKT